MLLDRMLTTAEVAQQLRVRVITVQRWLHRGRLRGVKLPGRAGWRVPASEVDRLLGTSAEQAVARDPRGDLTDGA